MKEDEVFPVKIRMIEARVVVPEIPRKVLYESGTDMDDPNDTVDIADLTDESLKALGKAWARALLAKAKERRAG